MGFFSDVFDFVFGWLLPDPPKQLAPGAELTSASTEASIAKVYGKVQKKAGHIVFKETNDVDNDDYPNDLLHIIVVWSESVVSIDEVYIDDIPASSNDDAFYAGSQRAVHVRNFPNGIGNYSDSTLTAAGWRSSDKLTGKACTYIRLEYHDDETAITSEPNLTADLTGTLHSNPATALRDYLTNAVYGKGLSSSLLDIPSFSAAEQLCDSDVEEKLGGGVYRDLFTCNVALDTSNTVLENVNTLLKPMRGWLPVVNGKLRLIIEEDSAPVSVPILERDIIQIGKITEGNKNSRYNRVVVTYYDPAADGSKQEAVYPEKDSVEFDELLAEDNGVLLEESVDLKTCRSYYEALEFAKTYLEVSRHQMRTSITLPKWATIYQVGDIVPVTYMSGIPFWDAKLFRIESTEESRDEVTLKVREHQPFIYDFYGLGNKPELPDTSYVNQAPSTPTDLNVEHVYSNFVQVRTGWVSDAHRFDYRVLKGSVIVKTERIAGKEVDLSGFDMGEYRFQVRAIGGLGKRSGWAETPLVLQEPGVPTNIAVVQSDLELEVVPYLEGSDSSTSFLFSISYDTEDTEPPTPHRGPAHTYTFSGLAPNTEYKVWVASYNALGQSQWTSVLAITTNASSRWSDIVRSIDIPELPNNLGDTILGITADIENWSQQSSQLGTDYSSLIYNVTEVAAANQVNQLDILAVSQKVGDSSVQAQITEFKNAQIGYTNENGQWVQGAAFAQAFQEVRINNLAGDEVSVFSYFQAIEDSIGAVSGQIQFAINANGRLTGVFINGSETASDITFLAENTYWVDPQGYVVLGVNTTTGELEFNGGGTFTGKLRSATREMIGPNVMELENPEGFGADDLSYWRGPTILDGNGDPDYSAVTKANAHEWKDIYGSAYFGGSLSSGVLRNGADASLLTLNPSLEVGPFTTNGNSKTINYSIGWSGASQQDGYCPSSVVTPSCTLILERSLDGGTWTQLQSHTVEGSVNMTELNEPEISQDPSGYICHFGEITQGGFTYTDNETSLGTFAYRLRVTNQVRYHVQNNINFQNINLISVEERPS